MNRSLCLLAFVVVVTLASVQHVSATEAPNFRNKMRFTSARALAGDIDDMLTPFNGIIQNKDELKASLVAQCADFLDDYAGRVGGNFKTNHQAAFETQFVGAMKRFFTRLNTHKASLVGDDNLGLTQNFKVTGITHSKSDPHGSLDSLLIVKTTDDKKFVYKPSSVDAHFYVQSKDAKSFVSTLNAKITTENALVGKPRLPTYKVFSLSDDHGKYGFIQFINKEEEINSFQSFQDFSYRAGIMAAACYVCGVVDLHFENIMVSGNAPYIIDAEAGFSPRSQFTLTTTELFAANTGAFDASNAAQRQATGNSDAKYYRAVMKPLKDKIREGFKDTIDFIAANNAHFTTWATTTLPDTAVGRFVIAPTQNAYYMRRDALQGLKAIADAAGDQKAAKTTELKNKIKGHYNSIRMRNRVYERDYDIALYGLFGANQAPLIKEGDISILANFVKAGEKSVYFDDLATKLTATNSVDLSASVDPIEIQVRTAAGQLADPTALLAATPKSLIQGRIAALADAQNAKSAAAMVTSMNDLTNNYSTVVGGTWAAWLLGLANIDPWVWQ